MEAQRAIVHLGCGAFFRAHQARYLHLLREQGSDWYYIAMNIGSARSAERVKQLRQQDYRYHLLERDVEQERLYEIRSLQGAMHPALDGVAALIKQIAAPEVAIVSLTITEKGYCLDTSSGELDVTHPDIVHDIAHPHQPKTAIGYLVAGLQQRFLGQGAPLSVMSCDNLQHNGDKIRRAVIALASRHNPQLAEWIRQHISFPNTMVDRIVPAVNEQTLSLVAEKAGQFDPLALSCEGFSQWVIEDHFVAGRPEWEKVGVQLTDDVTLYELMKLSMLNGSHSFLAWLGYLAGYKTIADTIANPNFKQAVSEFLTHEQIPTLTPPPNINLTEYAQQLIDRFTNPAIQHQTAQIASDGSQKLPQRLIGPLLSQLQQQQPHQWQTLAIAAWVQYIQGVDDKGQAFSVVDPLAATFQTIVASHTRQAEIVQALLGVKSIFGSELPTQRAWVAKLVTLVERLHQSGAKQTINQLLAEHTYHENLSR